MATTLEKTVDLLDETLENARKLRIKGVTVLHGVDATKLDNSFGSAKFDNIVFQFPHSGTRDSIGGHNSNFILARNFLRSAAAQLAINGRIFISVVDSPHYRGAFQLEKAADVAGLKIHAICSFAPEEFVGYNHTMSHESGSALDGHNKFHTWIFAKC